MTTERKQLWTFWVQVIILAVLTLHLLVAWRQVAHWKEATRRIEKLEAVSPMVQPDGAKPEQRSQ